MQAAISQSFYRSLVARNLIAVLIMVCAGAFSTSFGLAQQVYSDGKAFAPAQNLQNGPHAAALAYMKNIAATGKVLGSVSSSIAAKAGKLGWYCCETHFLEIGSQLNLLLDATG